MTLPKVAIGIPFYRQVEGPMFQSALGMAFYSASKIQVLPINCSGAYVESNRNGIVEYAMEIEQSTGISFDWLMWLDTDMIFPHDTLLRLIAHDKDIVGANYRTRTAPYTYAGHYLDEDDRHVNDSGLVPMRHLPTGLLLIRFEVLRQMARIEAARAEVRMADHPKAIELLRRNGYELAARDLTERMSPFPDAWFRAPRNRKEPRDDVYFCWTARDLGYDIWCDMDLTKEVFHRTIQDLSWFDPGQLVYDGAGLDVNKAKMENDMRARETGRQLAAHGVEDHYATIIPDTAERRGQDRTDGMVDPGARSAA